MNITNNDEHSNPSKKKIHFSFAKKKTSLQNLIQTEKISTLQEERTHKKQFGLITDYPTIQKRNLFDWKDTLAEVEQLRLTNKQLLQELHAKQILIIEKDLAYNKLQLLCNSQKQLIDNLEKAKLTSPERQIQTEEDAQVRSKRSKRSNSKSNLLRLKQELESLDVSDMKRLVSK